MDAGAKDNPALDDSIDLLREHRDEMAVWLALEVLQLDPIAPSRTTNSSTASAIARSA